MPTEIKINRQPKILIVCNYYLPGYKSGGGLRTLVNMIERFKDRFDFRVITRDHDGDKIPYTNVKLNQWNEIDSTKVYYLSANNVRISKLRELITEVEPDAIYLNSVFSTLSIFLLILLKFKLIPKRKIILAPEGELSDGALQLKARKKKAFIKFAKKAGLYQNIIWKVTAELEKQETERFKGSGGQIFIAPNMPSPLILKKHQQKPKPKKEIGKARLIFLSRYMRKKNFKWLLDNLHGIEGNLQIDIFGPLEDKAYWEETEKVIDCLPANIKIEYKGSLAYEKAIETLIDYHFFILPTLGENFGHVFIEALAAGCPLIISDRTPWLDLEKKQIGWDIPLGEPEKWLEVLNQCIKLDDVSYRNISNKSREFAADWLTQPEIEEDTLRVLEFGLKTN